jgi:small subunit ribosomal protein S8
MCVNFQLADLLVRIKVGCRSYDRTIKVKYTDYNIRILTVLYRQGVISSFHVLNHKDILVTLKYVNSKPLIKDIKLISKPGRRIFWTLRVLSLNYNKNSLNGFYILSTPYGLLTEVECLLNKHISGEVLFQVTLE